jgi:hypothetical protein
MRGEKTWTGLFFDENIFRSPALSTVMNLAAAAARSCGWPAADI